MRGVWRDKGGSFGAKLRKGQLGPRCGPPSCVELFRGWTAKTIFAEHGVEQHHHRGVAAAVHNFLWRRWQWRYKSSHGPGRSNAPKRLFGRQTGDVGRETRAILQIPRAPQD